MRELVRPGDVAAGVDVRGTASAPVVESRRSCSGAPDAQLLKPEPGDVGHCAHGDQDLVERQPHLGTGVFADEIFSPFSTSTCLWPCDRSAPRRRPAAATGSRLRRLPGLHGSGCAAASPPATPGRRSARKHFVSSLPIGPPPSTTVVWAVRAGSRRCRWSGSQRLSRAGDPGGTKAARPDAITMFWSWCLFRAVGCGELDGPGRAIFTAVPVRHSTPSSV